MAAIDRDHLPCHPGGLFRDEEENAVRDVLGLAEATCRDLSENGALPLLPVALPLTDARRVGEHEAGRDAVHGDAERAELVRGLAREADLARLGTRVRLDPGEADAAAGARGDVDDPSVAGRLHPGHDRPRADEGALQVRVDDGLPVLVGDLLEWTADLPDDAAGVVDEDVDWADLLDERGHLRAIGDVDRVLVHAVHRRAVALERRRDRRADPLRSPRDERGASPQVRHATSRSRSGRALPRRPPAIPGARPRRGARTGPRTSRLRAARASRRGPSRAFP